MLQFQALIFSKPQLSQACKHHYSTLHTYHTGYKTVNGNTACICVYTCVNMTFVEKYMSVSASGGTGRVATSVSCFGGLGQLYRVKVWAVSGPNISPALVCTPDGQCREEGGRRIIGAWPVLFLSIVVECMFSIHC